MHLTIIKLQKEIIKIRHEIYKKEKEYKFVRDLTSKKVRFQAKYRTEGELKELRRKLSNYEKQIARIGGPLIGYYILKLRKKWRN
ncbi:MAG: hypothetical protein DRP01_05415 [Archaeoglobales archaeon]|nr:MAG: hypothetical protein DRP01_05415 [Archaeoglobales archaeon]